MKLGVCYYPEHWPPERWPIDAHLMREAGLSIVRIGEFAWQKMEPTEDNYDWNWLDKAIATLAAEGLQVVLCTPTATPPAWLIKAYPDILPVDSQGRRRNFGSRRHYCANNINYHRYTTRIVTELAQRYGQHPAVIGWQTDNEFGLHETGRCYCQNCTAQFRSWLQEKYKTLEALNEAWGTVFWNQGYSKWAEIDLPMLTVTEANPSQRLDYYRFSSDSVVKYQQLQISLLKPLIAERHFITHNFMGNYPELDCYELARPLDFASWDSYPAGYAEVQADLLYAPSDVRPTFAYDVGDPYVTGFCHDLMRGLKQKAFWVMEQGCGNVNWSPYNVNARPGTVRLWTWHALAAGAEAVVYFRWRAGLYAQEQYHSGLLHHDTSPAVGYDDVLAMLPDRVLMAKIVAEPTQAEVALLFDYKDLWALQIQPHRKDFGYLRHQFVFYRALQQLGIPCDIVPPEADLSNYKLVIAPTAFLVSETLAETLETYVERGGSLLFGIRSGFKTATNVVTDQPLPGLFRDLVGATVADWASLPPGVEFDLQSTIPNFEGKASVWVEALTSDRQPLIAYTSGPFSGKSALVESDTGIGRAFYLGFYPTQAQAVALMVHLANISGVNRLLDHDAPPGLIVTRRGPYTLLLNFTDDVFTISIGGQSVNVKPRDVTVI